MAEEEKVNHDGWKSRKAQMAVGAMIVPFLTATVMIYTGKMESSEWIDLVKWLVPLVFGSYAGANALGKRA